jgi:hypothetical protein
MFVKLESGEIVYRVVEAKVFHQSHEVAAWYTAIQVEAGDYPVTMYRDCLCQWKSDDINNCYWVSVRIPGTITEDYFPALFGGVKQGSYDSSQNAGKAASYGFSVYGYEVRSGLQKQADLEAQWLASQAADVDQLSDEAQDRYEDEYASYEEGLISEQERNYQSSIVSQFSRSAR